MATRTTSMKGTPQTAATAQPWPIPAFPGRGYGIPLGPEVRTGKFLFLDQYGLRESNPAERKHPEVNGLICELDGVREAGKSAFMKSFGVRAYGMQAGLDEDGYPIEFRTRISSQRQEAGSDEYDRTCKAMHGRKISPMELGRINALDATLSDEVGMLNTAINLAETDLGRRLQGLEPLAHQVAMATMWHEYGESSDLVIYEQLLRNQTIEDAHAYYTEHNRRLAAKMEEKLKDKPKLLEQLQLRLERSVNIPQHEFERDSATMAATMHRLLYGDYGNLLGDEVFMRDFLGDPFLVIDQSQMTPRQRNIFNALIGDWMVHAMDHNMPELVPHLSMGDESQDDRKSLMWLRNHDNFVRKARSYHTMDIRATQYQTLLRSMGAPDSEERKLAEAISLGTSMRIVGKQPNDADVLDALCKQGFSNFDAELTTTFDTGRFALKLPKRKPIVFDYVLTPLEEPIVASNDATKKMLQRTNVWDAMKIRDHVAKYGAEVIDPDTHDSELVEAE